MKPTQKTALDWERILESPAQARFKLVEDFFGPVNKPLHHAVAKLVREVKHNQYRRELLGSVLGAYRLTAVLGHGGASTVYLGERTDRQYQAQVAVKVVENALMHEEVAKRFQAERQILANLNHPYIARLLDAGETHAGQPFLVMEYVHGEPIDRYCDSRRLTLKERLQLFIKVCAAVQYAHQNLVIHRDLKPGNILVTPDGTPKLLDFGIAKLMDASARLAAELALTRLNDRVLTPEYASPEQILGQNVTTASDVYALGVLLYELLAGTRPYQVSAVSQLELERSICIMDPPRLSQMVDKLSGEQANVNPLDIQKIAESRSSKPRELKLALAGDIDAIVLKALRKEPDRRYSTVMEFAEDLRRYLNGEKVSVSVDGILVRAARRIRSILPSSENRAHFRVPRDLQFNSSEKIQQLSERYQLSSEEIVDRAISAYNPENHDDIEPEFLTLLDDAHKQLKLCLSETEGELAQVEQRLRAIEGDAMRTEIRGNVERWVAVNQAALEKLTYVLPSGALE